MKFRTIKRLPKPYTPQIKAQRNYLEVEKYVRNDHRIKGIVAIALTAGLFTLGGCLIKQHLNYQLQQIQQAEQIYSE
jgi:hypothetical protein